jgi:hypothetical protein
MRSFLRAAAVVLLALYGFATTLPDVAILWRPFGTFGLTTDVEGRVRSVAPSSPAAEAHIQPGDSITGLSAAPVTEVWVLRPGIKRVVTVTHAGAQRQVTLTAQPTRLPAGGSILYSLRKVLGVLFIVAGMFLVLVRGSPATWGFFLYCVGANPFEGWYLLGGAMPPKVYLACSILDDIMNAAGVVGLLTFALYFPRSTVTGWRARVQRFIPWLFALTAALNLAVDLSSWFAKPPQWFANAEEIWFDALFLVAAAFFVQTYASTRGVDRERVAWATFGMVVGMVGLASSDIFGLFTWSVFSSAGWFERLSLLLVGAVPVAIIYAAIRHRVLDFSLAVNRTLVYGALTSLVVAAFAILHSFVVRELANKNLGLVTELAAAIAIGFWLNAIHQRVATFVDRVFFRKRQLARQRIERVADAVEYAKSFGAVDEMVAGEPYRALELGSGAVFGVERGPQEEGRQGLKRRRAFGWQDATFSRFDADDLLVLQLQAKQQSIRLADINWAPDGLPQGAAAPQFALPILSRHRLIGVALYGAHTSGSDLDPDEVAIISGLTRAAGLAYDRLEADELRQFIRDRVTHIHG